MSKIKDAFAKGKAFIPFVTCGDPDLETTYKVVCEMVKKGADIVELGIPFSDPTAEGPVIQEANIRALKNNVTTDDVFELVVKLRQEIDIPLVFMTYANVVFSYGTEKFLGRCKETGINGLILPDVPFEEKEDFSDECKKNDVELISLVAPTSENRISMIAGEAEGFVYVVSSLGVTGTRTEIVTDIPSMTKTIRKSTDLPCAVGFGISTPEQAKKMAQCADGVIVGSAIVKIIGKYGRECVPYVSEYVKSMKDAISF